MSKTILFLSKAESASSTRYRALQYFPNFIKLGWQPKHLKISGGLISIFKALILARKSDVVVLLRKTFPYPIFWLIRKSSKKLIFDFDDAIFCNTDGSFSRTRMKRFRETVIACDFIFAGNQYLATKAQFFNTNTIVIPTSVVTKKYDFIAPKSPQYIDIVWIGSQSTSKYLVEILPAIEMAASRLSNLRLKIIADFDLSSDVLNILPISWSENIEALELASSHLALAPLRNDDWSKGKCALKVLQYMAAGLPVISSEAGMNKDVVKNGITGYFASTAEEWALKIQTLACNSELAEKMGAAGKRAVQTYSRENIFLLMLNKIEH
jgi:glycosyltransferase involved in cell wall biosynthesis